MTLLLSNELYHCRQFEDSWVCIEYKDILLPNRSHDFPINLWMIFSLQLRYNCLTLILRIDLHSFKSNQKPNPRSHVLFHWKVQSMPQCLHVIHWIPKNYCRCCVWFHMPWLFFYLWWKSVFKFSTSRIRIFVFKNIVSEITYK